MMRTRKTNGFENDSVLNITPIVELHVVRARVG